MPDMNIVSLRVVQLGTHAVALQFCKQDVQQHIRARLPSFP